MVRFFSHLMPLAVVMLCVAVPGPALAGKPTRLTVAKVAILKNGIRSPDVSGDQTSLDCAGFRLTTADVRSFFRQAVRVTSRGYSHDLPMSPCQASGTVRFVNGWQGRWMIDSYRRGRFDRADGLSVPLFCAACTNAKFEPLDEEDRAVVRSVTVR
jgi:hypothetical protein